MHTQFQYLTGVAVILQNKEASRNELIAHTIPILDRCCCYPDRAKRHPGMS